MKNELLAQAEAAAEKAVPPELKNEYDRIMVAGMKVLFSEKTHTALVARLKESEDPVGDTGRGAVGLIMTLRKDSKGTMPVEAMIPAGASLMLNALDYLDGAGIVQIDKPEIDMATEIFIETLMPQIGLTPEKMEEMTGSVQSVMSDPEKMSQYQGGQQNGAA